MIRELNRFSFCDMGGPERGSGSRLKVWILCALGGVAKWVGFQGLARSWNDVSYRTFRVMNGGPMSMLVFDFDSTLVSVEALDELFARSIEAAADRDARIAEFKEITELGMAGELSAEESLERRLGVLEADRVLVDAVGEEISQRLTPSVEKHLDFFQESADRIYVLSGGFEEMIHPTLSRMGIPRSRLSAHRFEYDRLGKVTGLDASTPMARGGKPAALEAMGVGARPIWMVGDGATDLEIRALGLVDRFVAFTENRHREPVVARADAVARSMDELLVLLEVQ